MWHGDEIGTLHHDSAHSCTRGYKFSSLGSADVLLSAGVASRWAASSLKGRLWIKVMQARGKARESLFIRPRPFAFASFCPRSRCLSLISNLTSSVHSLYTLSASNPSGPVSSACVGLWRRRNVHSLQTIFWYRCLKIQVPPCCLFYNVFCGMSSLSSEHLWLPVNTLTGCPGVIFT